MTSLTTPTFAAEGLLARLKANGIDYLFANGGTDFAPLIEGYANGMAKEMPMPVPIIVPHETAAMGMAHGYYLATGRAQAVMVHVNVGLGNCVMGVINAAQENVPIVVMSGRTPLTEFSWMVSAWLITPEMNWLLTARMPALPPIADTVL